MSPQSALHSTAWTYGDAVLVVLSATSVILAVLAITVAVVAIFGYRNIREAAIRAAQERAASVARGVAVGEVRDISAEQDELEAGDQIAASFGEDD